MPFRTLYSERAAGRYESDLLSRGENHFKGSQGSGASRRGIRREKDPRLGEDAPRHEAAIFEQVGHILVFGYQLGSGIATFAQVGPPLIVAVIFLVLLVVFYRKATS